MEEALAFEHYVRLQRHACLQGRGLAKGLDRLAIKRHLDPVNRLLERERDIGLARVHRNPRDRGNLPPKTPKPLIRERIIQEPGLLARFDEPDRTTGCLKLGSQVGALRNNRHHGPRGGDGPPFARSQRRHAPADRRSDDIANLALEPGLLG